MLEENPSLNNDSGLISNEGAVVFPAQVNLDLLDGGDGFIFLDNTMDYSSSVNYQVSGIGDINRDGIDDVIIGGCTRGGSGDYIGKEYIIFGSKENFPAVFNSIILNGNNGFTIYGINPGDANGCGVGSVGDVNADGIVDIIVSAPYANNFKGQSYIIFGSTQGFPAIFNLTNLNGANGFVLNGINQSDQSGYSVSGAGDVNNDGIDDVIIGAPYANNQAGQSYVVFGSREIFPVQFNLSLLDGQNGFIINGIHGSISRYSNGDLSGFSVSTAGDLNNDGITDIIIGAPGVLSNTGYSVGQSYVLFGSKDGFSSVINLNSLNGINGFTISGNYAANSGSRLGMSVSGAGDINNDGIADVIIGAPDALNLAGQSYLIFGNSKFSSIINVSFLNGTNGYTINGIHVGSQGRGAGVSVSEVGDINKDGIDDIIIGSWGTGSGNAALFGSYIVFGGNKSFSSVLELSTLNGINGFIGDSWPYPGSSVSRAGDVNGDGNADFIIGSQSYNGAGKSYIVFNAASITPTPIPSPSPIPTPTPENHELSSGAIAGIVISGVVTILGGFLCYAKHRGWITEPAPVQTYHPMPASAPVPEPRVNMPLSDFLDLLRRAAGR